MVLDLPDPFGPTIAENDCRSSVIPAHELVCRVRKSYFVEGTNVLSASVTLEVD